MLFNFDDMEETILHNFNGGKNDTKAKMFIDENVKILMGHWSRVHLWSSHP